MNSVNSWYSKCGSLAAAVAATMLVTSTAQAGSEGKLMLSAYADSAAGESVMAGDYSAVIAKLAPHSVLFTADAVGASTNLCVAYVATRQFAQAKAACDEALHLARLDAPSGTAFSRLWREQEISIAQSNREVLAKLETAVVAKLEAR